MGTSKQYPLYSNAQLAFSRALHNLICLNYPIFLKLQMLTIFNLEILPPLEDF